HRLISTAHQEFGRTGLPDRTKHKTTPVCGSERCYTRVAHALPFSSVGGLDRLSASCSCHRAGTRTQPHRHRRRRGHQQHQASHRTRTHRASRRREPQTHRGCNRRLHAASTRRWRLIRQRHSNADDAHRQSRTSHRSRLSPQQDPGTVPDPRECLLRGADCGAVDRADQYPNCGRRWGCCSGDFGKTNHCSGAGRSSGRRGRRGGDALRWQLKQQHDPTAHDTNRNYWSGQRNGFWATPLGSDQQVEEDQMARIRLRRFCVLAVAAGMLPGASTITGPVAGYAVESSGPELRAIYGVPGSYRFSDPLPLPDGVTRIHIAPGQDFALVERGNAGLGILFLSGGTVDRVAAVDGAMAAGDWVAFSPAAGSVVLFSSSANRMQVLSGLPDTPRVTMDLDASTLPELPLTGAVSDDGQMLLVASDQALYLVPPAGAAQLLLSAGEIVSVVMLRNGTDAAVSEGSTGSVHILLRIGSAPVDRLLASGLAG